MQSVNKDENGTEHDVLVRQLMISSKSAITEEWVGDVLNFAGVNAPRIDHVSVTPIGAGNMCETFQVAIEYAGNAGIAPRSLVCKLSSTTQETVDFAVALGMYSREAHVLNALAKHRDVRVPRAFLAAATDDGRAVNLVLEDLSARATLGDQVTGISNAEAEAGVVELARFQRAFWNDTDVLSASWLFDRASRAEVFANLTEAGAEQLVERFTGRLPDGHLQAVRDWLPHTVDWIRLHSHGPTLVHGEPRADNMLFETVDGETRAWLIDFQLVDSGPPMFDMAYFVVQSLPVDRRREMEKDLIRLHDDIIAEVDPSRTYELALEEYAASLSMVFLYGICATCVIEPSDPGDRLLMSWIDRAFTAVQDWGIQPHEAELRHRP